MFAMAGVYLPRQIYLIRSYMGPIIWNELLCIVYITKVPLYLSKDKVVYKDFVVSLINSPNVMYQVPIYLKVIQSLGFVTCDNIFLSLSKASI